jgi:hypothetical protein
MTREEAQEFANRAAASERRAAKKIAEERDALQAKLAQFEEAQKSESQKAIEAAEKRAAAAKDAEWSQKLTAIQVDAELRLRLQAQGYDPDWIDTVKRKANPATIDDIDDAIATALADKPRAQQEPKVPSQTGAPGSRGSIATKWSKDKIDEARARRMRGEISGSEWAEMSRDIERAIRAGDIS